MADQINVYKSCGNIFADLGFENADEMLAKAELVRQISLVIEQRNFSIEKTAELLEISQAELLDLLEGNLMLFTTENLIRFLNKLGRDVEIVIKKKDDLINYGKLTVLS